MLFFSEMHQAWFDKVEIGKCYSICNGRISRVNPRFNRLNHEYEIICNYNTKIEEIEEIEEIPLFTHDFIKIDQIRSCRMNSFVDIIGKVTKIGEQSSWKHKDTGIESIKRVLSVNDTTAGIDLTVWSEDCNIPEDIMNAFKKNEDIIIAVKQSKIVNFNNISLSGGQKITFNPKIVETRQLRELLEKKTISTLQLSTDVGLIGDDESIITITNAIQMNMGEGKTRNTADVFVIEASIDRIFKNNMWYMANLDVNSEGFLKKCKYLSGGNGWFCEQSQEYPQTVKPKFSASMILNDGSENRITVTVFEPVAIELFGQSAEQLKTVKDKDERVFDTIIAETELKQYHFKIKAYESKIRSDDGESRFKISYTIIGLKSIN